MKIIKIKNWESLNCNKLLFILVEILANNKNILIYIKSKHLMDNLVITMMITK